MKNFLVIGGQCPRRKLDAQTAKNYFMANGYICVNDYSEADFIIIFTCGAFEKTEKTFT